MNEWYEVLCAGCGRKLADIMITDGTVKILCRKSLGGGQGVCNIMNTVSVEGAKISTKFRKVLYNRT